MIQITEDKLEQEAITWLSECGYESVYGPDIAPDGPNPERQKYQDVLLEDRLKAAIDKLNPSVPKTAKDDAFNKIKNLNTPVLLSANRIFHNYLVNGIPVEYQKDHETRGDFVKIIDFNSFANNEWLAVNQYTVRGERNTRRADIVLFVNGLPIVLIELKNPLDEQADIWKAFDQIKTYKDQISDLFQYNEIIVISDGSEAKMGSLSATEERYMSWRTINGTDIDPLGQFSGLETMIKGLFDPVNLIEYLKYLILFEDDGSKIIKKIGGYHQYHAVKAGIKQIRSASDIGGDKKGGVVWHTQGSGKSITMTCLAARVMQDKTMKNPTIVVITDRNDLDGQLLEVFSHAQDLLREKPVQVEDRKDLRAKLNNRPSGGIIFTTIQKFLPNTDEDSYPELSERHNVVVIADEAHRTQYGFTAKLNNKQKYSVGYAQHLRDALPNATFIAFTGTPVSSDDRDTRAVFGQYIHIYDIQQAKDDGATVALYYESRLAKLSLNQEELKILDQEVEELSEDEEGSAKAKLKSKWAALEKIMGTESRIKQIALDLVNHFEERNKAIKGKAMIVGMSREICAHLYNAITELRPNGHNDDPKKGAIKVVITGTASDSSLLQPHIYTKNIRKDLEKRFKNPDDEFKLVIVRDMWLTGFDAPCAHTIYIDKPMKGHNLMQSIARVNRVFKDKQGGLIVDYIGIANDLKRAMKDYTASNGHGEVAIDAREAFLILEEKISILRGILHEFDYSNFLNSGYSLLAKAANHVLGLPDGKKRFCNDAVAMAKAFTLCCTLDEAKKLREEVAFFQAIKSILTKRDITAQKLSQKEKDLTLRQMLNSAVISEEVIDIFDTVGLDKPNIGILDDAFLEEVKNLPERNLAVSLLEQLIQDQIKARFTNNIIQDKKFSELLTNTLRRYQNRTIETSQVIEELCEMAKSIKAALNRGESLGLNNDELAFYDALANNEASVKELGDEILKKIAHELTEKLRNNISVDWSIRESVRAKLRLMVKRILRKYKYPPDKQEEAIELVLKQTETLSAAWVDH